MRGRWLAAAAPLLLGVSLCAALTCMPCEKTTCVKVLCPGRTVRDVCGCCLVCARELGQPCGGYFDSLGLCDDGLVCQTSPQHGQPVDTGAEGICTSEYLLSAADSITSGTRCGFSGTHARTCAARAGPHGSPGVPSGEGQRRAVASAPARDQTGFPGCRRRRGAARPLPLPCKLWWSRHRRPSPSHSCSVGPG